jgi:hypothetical protein
VSRLRAQAIAKQLSAALAPHREILEAYLFGSLGREFAVQVERHIGAAADSD